MYCSVQIGFGGGCHWCTEAVFSALKGVNDVEQGFIKSHSPNDQFSEAVLVDFDDKVITLATLVEIHLLTHASASSHSMRKKYRSAIYVDNSTLGSQCELLLQKLQGQFEKPLVTQVLKVVEFKKNAESYLDYYETDPNRPFCISYIEPKLTMLKRDFSSQLKIR